MPDNQITLTTFDNVLEAHVVKGLLESEGVPVFLLGEHFFSAQNFINVGLAHIRLQVPKQQLIVAWQILQDYQKGAFEQPLIEAYNLKPVQCRQCGSAETMQVLSYTSFVAVAVLALYFIGLVIHPKKHTICKHCKTKF